MDAHKAWISNIFNNATMVEVPFFQRPLEPEATMADRLIYTYKHFRLRFILLILLYISLYLYGSSGLGKYPSVIYVVC